MDIIDKNHAFSRREYLPPQCRFVGMLLAVVNSLHRKGQGAHSIPTLGLEVSIKCTFSSQQRNLLAGINPPAEQGSVSYWGRLALYLMWHWGGQD